MSLPFFSLPTFEIPIPGTGSNLPLQPFGIIVATGVLIGSEILRRYGYRHGVDDDDIRSLTIWVIVTGFIGAHVLDILMYEQDRLDKEGPILLLKMWDGISSYGGFVGGAIGYFFWVWSRRMTLGLIGDTIGVGLLPAFSIGRIGCTIVHDHVGRATDSPLGVDYPRGELFNRGLLEEFASKADVIRAHNLAMYELAYLIPVNIFVLWLAFSRSKPGAKQLPAGMIAVIIPVVYAPVRFVLEYWRLNSSDPRYAGLTFAQWCSIIAFFGAGYAAFLLFKHGKPAPLAGELGGRPGGHKASLTALAIARSKGESAGDGGETTGDKPAAKKSASGKRNKRS